MRRSGSGTTATTHVGSAGHCRGIRRKNTGDFGPAHGVIGTQATMMLMMMLGRMMMMMMGMQAGVTTSTTTTAVTTDHTMCGGMDRWVDVRRRKEGQASVSHKKAEEPLVDR